MKQEERDWRSYNEQLVMRGEILLDLDLLKDWRNAAAEAEGVEPAMVVSNQILQEVSTRRPAAPADLEAIPAIRRWQLARYTDALLGVVKAFGTEPD